jgi:hypothetical protein
MGINWAWWPTGVIPGMYEVDYQDGGLRLTLGTDSELDSDRKPGFFPIS